MRKQKLATKSMVVIVFFSFLTAIFSAGVNAARIIPDGKVSIIKDGKVVSEFSRETTLPENSLLKCEAKCTIKLDDAYMVAESDTVFSVNSMANSHELTVEKGTVYFSVSETSRPFEFNTPAGDATMRDVSLNKNELMGYVKVSGNETEIGVIDGGTMMVETSNGEMAILPGRQITIALANPDATMAAERAEGGSNPIRNIALYTAEAAVLVGGMYLLTTIDGNSSDDGSPSSP